MAAPSPPSASTTTFLTPYLPHSTGGHYPFTTLTYAASLDSHLSSRPGTQTHLSGPLSKSLTHHLRTMHSALLIGVTTALTDDPGLNSRIPSTPLSSQPRPIILDPHFRWSPLPTTRVLRTAAAREGHPPFILVREDYVDAGKVKALEKLGGTVFLLPPPVQGTRWEWDMVLRFLRRECGIESVMIEGGGEVINSLLEPRNQKLVDSVIVTIAPVYLGRGGVGVRPIPRAKFKDIGWCVLGNDVVMAARPDLDL